MKEISPEEFFCNAKLLNKFPLDTEKGNPCFSRDIQFLAGKLTLRRSWDKLYRLAFELRGRAFADLNSFQSEFDTKSTFVNNSCLTCMSEEPITKVATALKNPEDRKEIEKELKKNGYSTEFINKFKKSLSGEFQKKLRSVFKFPFRLISDRSQYTIALGLTGFLAGFHSLFNQQITKKPIPYFNEKEIELIQGIIENEDQKNFNGLLDIHSAISSGQREKMRLTSWKILQSQDSNLKRLAVICSSICKATLNEVNNNKSKIRSKLGKVDLLMGHTCRRWLFLSVTALYANRIALLAEDDPEFQNAVKKARRLRFESKIPNGKNITINKLIKNSDKNDGKYLEITGFVRNLKATRRGYKFFTKFELYEPEKRQKIPVIVIFENMGRHGMINDSYIRVHGTWKKKSNVVRYPVLQVERLKLTKYSKSSWLDYLLTRVRPWFDFYPNSNHVEWSIRPQPKWINGKKNYNSGAGELIFIKPFIMSRFKQ